MKYKLTIKKDDQIIFEGKPINLPIKEEVLKQKSIEMFADDEPCIIHQTYVIETFCDELVSRFKTRLNEEIELSDEIKEINFINIKDIKKATLMLRRK